MTKFDLTTDSSIETNQAILVKYKISYCQHIAKIILKQQSLKKIRHFLTVHKQIWLHFLSNYIKLL